MSMLRSTKAPCNSATCFKRPCNFSTLYCGARWVFLISGRHYIMITRYPPSDRRARHMAVRRHMTPPHANQAPQESATLISGATSVLNIDHRCHICPPQYPSGAMTDRQVVGNIHVSPPHSQQVPDEFSTLHSRAKRYTVSQFVQKQLALCRTICIPYPSISSLYCIIPLHSK